MYDISRAHFHGVPVRRVFVELLDVPDLEYAGLLEKCMYGSVDASVRWQAHYAQSLEEHSFAQSLCNPALFVHVEPDMRLLVHGDDFMVEMPALEEKWFEGVWFSKYDGKCTEKFH